MNLSPLSPTVPAGGEILLGWESEEHLRPLGFQSARLVPRNAEARAIPVHYRGGGHLCTVAPTGAGKGVSGVIPTLLKYPGSMVVMDPKGENHAVTARRRQELGQQVYLLDPFRIRGEGGAVDGLNPLDLIPLDPCTPPEDTALQLAEMITGESHMKSDPYWDHSARGLLAGMIGLAAADPDPTRRSIRRLVEFFSLDDLDYSIAVLLDTTKDMPPGARRELINYLQTPADKTRPCVRASAFQYVRLLGSPAVLESLRPGSIDLRAFQRGDPMTIYVVLPPSKLESHRSLLRLWIGTLLAALSQRRSQPINRTLVLLDEVAQLGTLEPLRCAMTLLRGFGVQTWTFWQSFSQMRRLYPTDWQSVIENCSV
ncbi:MAG TPA: type IV secretory system conjugative DNA transfer family protein, partial [Thermomicrobiales bacterium]|nr:type IV secretory system conjugative DNA transfer family protein [Thermomicrobiales bacterium]